ncbi:hypothetical protein CIB84_013454, partial [Bambusicola thoracicus]
MSFPKMRNVIALNEKRVEFAKHHTPQICISPYNTKRQLCMLCCQAQVNPDICGQTFANGGLCAPPLLLVLSYWPFGMEKPQGRIFGFSINAVQRTIQLADQKHCSVCGRKGAAISCVETGCTEDGECITQYFGQH